MTLRLFIYNNFVLNVDSDAAAARILADEATVRELTSDEITYIFGDYAAYAGPTNTSVDADGCITFDFDEEGYLSDLKTNIKQQRDALLAASDWRYLSGNEAYQTSAWSTYRQALRDITDQEGYPINVEWPTSPDAS